MITYPATKTELVRNTKTGTTGFVICRYNRRNDGKAIVQVNSGAAKDAYWLASRVEAA